MTDQTETRIVRLLLLFCALLLVSWGYEQIKSDAKLIEINQQLRILEQKGK